MSHGRHYRVGDFEYGRICPGCAGPKEKSAGQCRDCYSAQRRAGFNPPPPQGFGEANSFYRHGQYAGGAEPRNTGLSKGRPQPQSHRWRRGWGQAA